MRILRACRELGIRGVAVYSEADAHALHVRLADEAVEIGPAPARQSYLSSDRLIEAAQQCGAQAIHPGYGFLSENAAFTQAVREAGLVFIGPPPAAIRAMGDKAAARERMQAAGVPVVPGYQGTDDDQSLEQAAAQIGYPVLAKAAAGGGGRGMRVVWQAEQLHESLDSARREALSAFGDQRLILEKYLPGAHHVEFQVLGDQHGNLLHLFERECSVQRRHQKIIEESPSPLLDEDLRQRMGADAVQAARAAGYTNAGTVEFIIDPASRAYYFLEMNTRLQVEHPVTELVSGLDLVQWQVRIAAGEVLPFRQADLQPRGHAVECRLYAEDAARGFLPGAGKLLLWQAPEGPGIRLDAGYAAGDEVSIHYDALLAKLVCSAADRASAIRRAQAALEQLAVLGVVTNQAFLLALLASPEFAAGQVNTTWVDEHLPAWQSLAQPALPLAVLAAAALSVLDASAGQAAPPATADPFSPWAGSLPAHRPAPARPIVQTAGRMEYACQYGAAPQRISLERAGSAWQAEKDGQRTLLAVVDHRAGVIILSLEGRQETVFWAADGERLWTACRGQVYLLEKPAVDARRAGRSRAASGVGAAAAAGEVLRAPLPAQVRAIQAQPGQACERGQTLLVLEAMKMEIRIQAPAAGRVARLLVEIGQQVNRDQPLVEIETD